MYDSSVFPPWPVAVAVNYLLKGCWGHDIHGFCLNKPCSAYSSPNKITMYYTPTLLLCCFYYRTWMQKGCGKDTMH